MLLLYLPFENVSHSFSYFHFFFLFFKKKKEEMKKKQKWLLIDEAYPTGEPGTWAEPELDRKGKRGKKTALNY